MKPVSYTHLAGYSDEDIRQKPHIGIPNSYMAGSPGTAHLRQVTEAVKEGIWAAGGIPVEFGIPATCGNVANGADEMKYEQVGKDIVAMSIEFVSRIHNFDAICCVASCDLIIAGCYLAACRLDIPALVVTGGSMQAGNYCGKTVVEADLDAARFSGASEAELFEMEESVCPSFGACPSMGTANKMCIRDRFKLDVPKEVIAMASGMAVGAGKSGCVCGAFNGGILALGLFFGRTEQDGPTNPKSVKCMELTHELHDLSLIHISAARKLTEMFMLMFGVFGNTMATYCGQNLGAGKIDRIKKGIWLAIFYTCI